MNSNNFRVLLAEDDATLAADLELYLRGAGYEVLAVEARGDATLTATRLLQPDIVLLSVRLRGPLDGLAVASALRAHQPSPVPVVFLSTASEDPAVQSLRTLAPVAALQRPLLTQHLQQVLTSALGA